MVYKHAAVIAAFGIYAQQGEDIAKRGVGGSALNRTKYLKYSY